MRRPLRTTLLLGLLALQAIAVVATIFLTNASTNRVLVRQMDARMATAGDNAVSSAEAVLSTAEDSTQLTQRAIESGIVDPTDTAKLERFLLDELATNELIDAAYFGTPDGGFLMVQHDRTRTADGFVTKEVTRVSGVVSTTRTYRDAEFDELATEDVPGDDFDPRTRPWYQLAAPTDGSATVWTEPYIFATSKEPGVTNAAAVYDDGIESSGARFLGVAGVDVELAGLSETLGVSIDVSPNGVAVVADSEGVMVATSNRDEIVHTTGAQELRRARVEEFSKPQLGAAFAAGKDVLPTVTPDAPVTVAFDYGGETYRATFAKVESKTNWYVAVVAPQSDFVGEIERIQRVNALIVVGVGIAVVVLALPVVNYVAGRGERLESRANTDALTGLANRRHFEEVLTKEIARAHDRSRSLSVAMLDLDHFKGINDTHGHGVGDQALIRVSRALEDAVRDDDLVARLGGDEFAVLLIGEDLDRATSVLERARQAIEATELTSDAGAVPIRVTAGVADLIPGVADNAALLRRADQALYVAKERGRNQVATIRDVDPAVAGVTVPSAGVAAAAPARTPSAPLS